MSSRDAAAGEAPALLLKTIQGNAVRTLFEVLKEIVHDVNLCVDPTGVKLLTMDGAKCALVYLKLDADAFEVFRCAECFRLGVNMGNVFKLLKTSGSHDTITLYADSVRSSELGIRIQNADRNVVTDFKLALMDVDEDIIKLPEIVFDSVITMPAAFFQRLCRDMSNIGDVMTIRSEGSRLVLACAGDYARQETVIGEADAGMNVSTRPGRTIEGRFSLKYLSLFSKAANLSNTIELLLKENYPLILKYNVASLGELRFGVAPKLDDE